MWPAHTQDSCVKDAQELRENREYLRMWLEDEDAKTMEELREIHDRKAMVANDIDFDRVKERQQQCGETRAMCQQDVSVERLWEEAEMRVMSYQDFDVLIGNEWESYIQ